MRDIISSRFDAVPALVAPEHKGLFESCLIGLSTDMKFAEMVAASAQEDDGFWFSKDDWRSAYRPYNVRNGMLMIPVKGVLLSGFPYALGSYATGYQYIERAFQRGLADPEVRGIAFMINSPGGEVAENFDLVDKLYAGRGVKPIRAFAHESAYSAAYSIASAADEIAVSRTGGVGSIGVVTGHVDFSRALEEDGVKVTFIFAGKHKVDGNPYEPLPEDVKARIQARIDGLYSVFVATVARNRGMEESAVRATEALTFSASEALSNGLADSVASLDDAVAAFAAKLSYNPGDNQMSNNADPVAADKAVIEAARAEGHAQGHAEGLATGTAAGATNERSRITAIIGGEHAAARPKAALSAALKTDMTVEQAASFLADLPEEKAPAAETPAGQDFSKRMEADNPELGTNASGSKDEDGEVLTLARAFGVSGLRPAN